MRALVPSLAAAATLALAAPALAADPPATPVVPTQATVDACHFAPDQASRYVEFDGQMAAVSGTRRMLMRFDLQIRRDAHHRFRTTRRPPVGFGVWRISSPGVDVFRLRKQVTNLFAPGDYRATVRFRWLDGHGAIVKHLRLRTPVCHEPDPRPNLTIGGLSGELTPDATQARYFVNVANVGRSDAGSFDVVMSIDGAPQPAQTLTSLTAGAQQVLTFVGPPCSVGGPGVRVRVDPDHRVRESAERDDVRTFACPL